MVVRRSDPASRLPFGAKKIAYFQGRICCSLLVSGRVWGLTSLTSNAATHDLWTPPETSLTFNQVAAPWKQHWWLRKNWLHLLPVSMSPWNQRGWKEGNLRVTYGSGYTLHVKKNPLNIVSQHKDLIWVVVLSGRIGRIHPRSCGKNLWKHNQTSIIMAKKTTISKNRHYSSSNTFI